MKMSESDFQKLFNHIDNGFVGSEDHVYNYQNKYASFFDGKFPVLDIGCGQGAFLRALHERKIVAFGLDMDSQNVETCMNKGYGIVQDNAFTYLDKEDNKDRFGGVSMFHMIEHFDGETAVRLLVLIYEALEKDGVFALITPDFNDVGNHSFWLSSTHVRPYPLMWLENAFKEIGFEVISKGKDSHGGDTFIVGVKRND